MSNNFKSKILFILYLLMSAALLWLLCKSILNRAWLHCIGDMGMLSVSFWLIFSSKYFKNKKGETKSLKYGQFFRWLGIIILSVYVLLLLR
jgi:hypothetical protein